MSRTLGVMLLGIIVMSTGFSQIPQDGLVAYYPFNGNANDASGNGNNGTVIGATLAIDRFGTASSAYSFDGASNYIDVPNNGSLQVTSSLTVAAWISMTPENNEAYQAVVTKGWNPGASPVAPDYYLGINHQTALRTNRPHIYANNSWSYLDGSTDISTGVWHFVAMTYNGSEMRSYVDGLLDGQLNVSGAISQSDSSLQIAVYRPGTPSTHWFLGRIDDIRIYNRALSSDEIEALYGENGWSSLNQGLLAYYPLNGDANDATGNGRDGIVTGAVGSEDRFGNPDYSYQLDGIDDYLTFSGFPLINDDFSYSIWIKVEGDNPSDYLQSFGIMGPEPNHIWNLSYNNNGGSFDLWDDTNGAFVASYPQSDSTLDWTHIVVRYSGGVQSLFTNGQLLNSRSVTLPINDAGGRAILVGILRTDIFSDQTFNGRVDDIRLYNRAIDSAEIQALYYEGGFQVDTSLFWSMGVSGSTGSVIDNDNVAGIGVSATDLYDEGIDVPEAPPSPGSYVTVYFPHPEWNSILGDNFAKDIRESTSLSDTVERWFFEVLSNVTDTVHLSFTIDRIPDAFGIWLTDLATGNRHDLRQGYSFGYYNGSDTAHPFMLAIGDSTPPALTLVSPTGHEIWRSSTDKTIDWRSSDGTGVLETLVSYTADAGTGYTAITTLGQEQTYQWSVPSEYLNHDYSVKVMATDSMGNAATVRSSYTFTVVGDSLETTTAAGWSLVSLPMDPDTTLVSGILADDMGGTAYYLWNYDLSTGYTIPTDLSFGTGYWLGVTTPRTWDVTGLATEADSMVQALPEGYTLIGSQYVRDVLKAGLSFVHNSAQYSFSEAVSAGLIVNAMYGYSGGAYVDLDTLKMFEGYWLGVIQTGVQLVQKPNASVTVPAAKTITPSAVNWELMLTVASATQTDDIATFGVKQDATDDFEVQYDVPRPPRTPGNTYLEAYFPHSGPNYPPVLGSKYARDFRGKHSPTWNFTVETSEQGNTTITWDNSILTGLGTTVQLTLRDITGSRDIEMVQSSSYSFDYTGPRQFAIVSKITAVDAEGNALPTEYELSQNYPNPFNPTTTFRYALPEDSRVTVKLYNMLGMEVMKLQDASLPAGYHSQVLDASTLGSGVYLYRLEAVSVDDPSKRFVDVKKMILLR